MSLSLRRGRPAFTTPRHSVAPTPRAAAGASAGTTLAEFFQSVYAPERLLAAKRSTLAGYRTTLGQLDRWLGRDFLIGDLTPAVVAGFLRWRLECGASVPTVNKQRGELAALASLAARRYPGQVFALDVPPLPEPLKLPEAWTAAEFARIVSAAGQARGRIGGCWAGDWWRALLLVLYDTGGRIAAVMAARAADYDAVAGTLLLRAETQKHRADELCDLAADTCVALAALRDRTDPAGPLFPWPWDRGGFGFKTLRKHYRKILRAAGLPCGAKDLFHRVRRTTATLLAAEAGLAEASRLLGHSSVAVTQAHYLDRRVVRRRHLAETLPRPAVAVPPTDPQRWLF